MLPRCLGDERTSSAAEQLCGLIVQQSVSHLEFEHVTNDCKFVALKRSVVETSTGIAIVLINPRIGDIKMLSTILLIVLILLLLGAVPAWPYSRGWGYYPSGGIGLLVVILVVLLLAGRI